MGAVTSCANKVLYLISKETRKKGKSIISVNLICKPKCIGEELYIFFNETLTFDEYISGSSHLKSEMNHCNTTGK